MAINFYISDETTTVNLVTGPLFFQEGGLELEGVHKGRVWETYKLLGVGTQESIRSAMLDLERLLEIARMAQRSLTRKTVVNITWASEGETNKSAMVYDGRLKIEGGPGWMDGLLKVGATKITLAIQRGVWEAALQEEIDVATDIDQLGGMYDVFTSDDISSLGHRIKRMSIYRVAGSGSAMTKMWCGVRPKNNGVSGFIALWECESGTNSTDATDVYDATASGTNKVRVSFATVTTLSKRFTITWDQIAGSNYNHLAGEYLILARIKPDASSTQGRVQLRAGVGLTAVESNVIGEVYVDGSVSTAWQIFELGRVAIPPLGNRSLYDYTEVFKEFTLAVYAERLSASGNIDFDCLVLMPCQHMAYVENIYLSATNSAVVLFTTKEGIQFAQGWTNLPSTGDPVDARYVFHDFYVPYGGGRLVFCFDGTLTNLIRFSMDAPALYDLMR